MDTTTVHLSLDGVHVKTVPSRQTTVSLTRLRSAGARPAGPPPSCAIALSRSSRSDDGPASPVAVEVDRVVNASGLIGLAGRYVSVGHSLAGRRITLRLDGGLAHVINDGVPVRTLPAPVPPALRRRLNGVRLAGPETCLPRTVTGAAARLQPRRHPSRRTTTVG